MRDWLRFAVSHFTAEGLAFGHGTSSALDEAAFLILSTLHLPIDQLEPWLDARLAKGERRAVARIIEQRIVTRKPAPYLTNQAWMLGHSFYVDERVIVPRSYIGELLQHGALGRRSRARERRAGARPLHRARAAPAILAALRFEDAGVDGVDLLGRCARGGEAQCRRLWAGAARDGLSSPTCSRASLASATISSSRTRLTSTPRRSPSFRPSSRPSRFSPMRAAMTVWIWCAACREAAPKFLNPARYAHRRSGPRPRSS